MLAAVWKVVAVNSKMKDRTDHMSPGTDQGKMKLEIFWLRSSVSGRLEDKLSCKSNDKRVVLAQPSADTVVYNSCSDTMAHSWSDIDLDMPQLLAWQLCNNGQDIPESSLCDIQVDRLVVVHSSDWDMMAHS